MSFQAPPSKKHPIPIRNPSSGETVNVGEPVPQTRPRSSPKLVRTERSSHVNGDAAPSRSTAPRTATPSNQASAADPARQTQADDGRNTAIQPAPAMGSSWTPDIYAPSYVPRYLLDINSAPAIDCHSMPLKTTDFGAYVDSFSGKSILQPVPFRPMPGLRQVHISLSRHVSALSPSTYYHYFEECLMIETYTHLTELSRLSLYNVTLTAYSTKPQLFTLTIPGLKDGAPRVELGDVVLVRQIVRCGADPAHSHPDLWHHSPQPGKNNTSGPVSHFFTGQQHRAVVWGVHRAKQTVLLRIDHLPPIPAQCNIIFKLQENRFVPLWNAVSSVCSGPSWEGLSGHGSAGGIQDQNSWMRHILFPEPTDGVMQHQLPRGSFPQKWIDKDLNAEQMKAVDAVVSRNFGNLPFLISGVPGSGKTKTLVECTLQLLRSSNVADPHILICAPSNPAADTLAIRLKEHLKPNELFRLNGYTRSFAEVPDVIMQYTYTEGDTFSLPEFTTMMEFKVVITTCADADMLVLGRLTNTDLMKFTYKTFAAVTRGVNFHPEQTLHWTALIVDEAAQATEPSVCIPLTVVANPLPVGDTDADKQPSLPVVVMAGDQHQLGPQVSNTDTALSVSIFERLATRSVYADHPLSRRNAGPRKRLTQSMLPILRPPFTNLVRNYRSHQAILAVPSVLFYSDTLQPAAPTVSPDGPVPTWPGWKRPHRWPVLFACNTSLDSVEEILHGLAGSGLYNDGEAIKALHYAQSLLRHSNKLASTSVSSKSFRNSSRASTPTALNPAEIAIISPFNSQVTALRNLFREHELSDVNIGPLEAFQGLESRFLIICTTRTRTAPRFVEQDQTLGLGLIGERKRFNVALTRAKEGVIVIGNPALLGSGRPARDEVWRAFLSFCARNGCWEPEDENTQTHVHKAKYKNGSIANGNTEPDDNGAKEARQDAAYWERKLAGILTPDSDSEPDRDRNASTEGKDPRLEGYVSSLEYGLLYGEKVRESTAGNRGFGNGTVCDDYDSAMWVSGTAAEEVLREWE